MEGYVLSNRREVGCAERFSDGHYDSVMEGSWKGGMKGPLEHTGPDLTKARVEKQKARKVVKLLT